MDQLFSSHTDVTTATPLSADRFCAGVLVQADPDNIVDVFIGNDASQDIQLTPGAGEYIPINNVNKIFARSADGSTSARVNWHAGA